MQTDQLYWSSCASWYLIKHTTKKLKSELSDHVWFLYSLSHSPIKHLRSDPRSFIFLSKGLCHVSLTAKRQTAQVICCDCLELQRKSVMTEEDEEQADLQQSKHKLRRHTWC